MPTGTRVISDSKIDFMLVTSTPEVVNPVADACEAAGIPCLSTVMPWETWYCLSRRPLSATARS